VSLTQTGQERWLYTYDGPWSVAVDGAETVTFGIDGNIYAGGGSFDNSTEKGNFTVVSLGTVVGSDDQSGVAYLPEAVLSSTFFRDKISIRFAQAAASPLHIALHNVLGEKILAKSFSSTPGSLELADTQLANLPTGVYFLSIVSGERPFPGIKVIKY